MRRKPKHSCASMTRPLEDTSPLILTILQSRSPRPRCSFKAQRSKSKYKKMVGSYQHLPKLRRPPNNVCPLGATTSSSSLISIWARSRLRRKKRSTFYWSFMALVRTSKTRSKASAYSMIKSTSLLKVTSSVASTR